MLLIKIFSGLVYFLLNAGTRLFHVAQELAELGRALPNLPDIDVQTLAGAFATGTHGTGAELAALHDYIEAFRIVLADGSVVDVDAETQKDLFDAGRVSLGALGIMTEFTLKTIPLFRLRRTMEVLPIEDVLEQAETHADSHRHSEFFYFPGTGLAALLTHDLSDEEPGDGDQSGDEETLEGLKQLRDQFGWSPWLRRKTAQAAFPRGLQEMLCRRRGSSCPQRAQLPSMRWSIISLARTACRSCSGSLRSLIVARMRSSQ